MKHKSLEWLPDDCVYKKMDSPIGDLVVIGNGAGIHGILWKGQHRKSPYAAQLKQMKRAMRDSPVERACQQLTEYFRGERIEFDVPVVFHGTVFQRRAWKQLQRIPYGATRSYQQQAAKVGGKEKARAVGLANGKNPIPIIVPCHRVIGKDGSLTGFGGGLKTKKYLLDLETSIVERLAK